MSSTYDKPNDAVFGRIRMRGIKHADILNDPADALIYSTNILLNCTGGVGGALLERYGQHFQIELHQLLRKRGASFASQGEVIDYVPAGLPYRHLIHTTPCDGMYDTTPSFTEDVLSRALACCSGDPSVRRVAVSALATGFGHLKFEDFLLIASRVFHLSHFATLQDIILCIDDAFTFRYACEIIQERGLMLEIDAEHNTGGNAGSPRTSA
jgi:O-acetyl-ADP-ribose deacetylase (regulator of RNase III)